MIVKGIVSAVYAEEKTLSVILPEYDNMTTAPLQIYGDVNIESFAVNDFVLISVFNNDFSDAMVIAKASSGFGEYEGAENKLRLFYIDKNGNAGLLKLGSGLTITNGVLCLTGTVGDATLAILGTATLGTMILGKEA